MSNNPNDIAGVQALQRIAKRALDPDETAYLKDLLHDPKSVLSAEGLVVEDDVDVIVLRNSAKRIFLVLPPEIGEWEDLDLNESHLRRIVPCTQF
jgi:shikimate kinase